MADRHGKENSAYQFDGDDYVYDEIASSALNVSNTNRLTISAWVLQVGDHPP